MKKLLSLIVALSMLAAAVPAAFALGETGYSDIDGTNYEGPVSTLRALGIMTGYEDGSFRPYSTVTRAEIATIGLHMRGIFDYGDKASVEELQFKDMDGHWAEAAVAYARSLGIIDGYDDGNFYPDEYVTYEQAVKIIVSTLGYDYYATVNGGYPNGYLAQASTLKLTSGVGLTIGSYITRGDLAKIVYNSLSVEIMEGTNYSNKGNEVTYTVERGSSVLDKYFDVEKLRGIVEANDRSGLYGEPTAKENQVKIGDELFNAGSTGIADYLGYYVTFYAMKSDVDENRTIISFRIESNKNNYIKLDADSIENVSLSSASYVFEYWNGKNTKSVKTSAAPLLIYNGASLIDFTVADLAPECGQVTLLDNDGDGRYDIIDVLDYDIMLVMNASSATGNVTAAYSTGVRGVKLDTDDDDYSVRIIDANGNNVGFDAIKKNTVAGVALSRDKNQSVRTIIVSNDSVSGRISSISENGNYVINGKEYEAVSYMSDACPISLGDEGTFFLSHDGKIAGFDGDTRVSKSIGIFVGYYDGEKGSNSKYIKILKADGQTQTFNLAGKVRLNGELYSGIEVFEMISRVNNPLFGIRSGESYDPKTGNDPRNAGKIIPDPSKSGILYKVNGDGKVSELVTVTANYGSADAETAEISVESRSSLASNFYYSTKYHCFHISDVKTYVSDSTLIFYSDDKASKTDDSQIYSVRNASAYYNNENVYYPICYFFHVNNSRNADFAFFYDDFDDDVSGTDDSNKNTDVRKFSMRDRIKVVDRIVERYDADHELSYRLVYWEGGNSKTLDFHPDKNDLAANSEDDLKWKRGDLVITVLTSGKITNIESIFQDNNVWNRDSNAFAENSRDFRYNFPAGCSEYWANYDYYGDSSLVQRYLLGRVTSIDTLKYFSTFNLNVGVSNQNLNEEPLEGDCYRLLYNGRGEISGVENVGVGAVAEDQLVLVRKNGSSGKIGCRVAEIYILYEASELTETQLNNYKNIYSDYIEAGEVRTAEADMLDADETEAAI